MTSRDRQVLLASAAVSALWLLLAAALGLDSGLLHFLPLFVLFVPLLSGRYVGEETLHRLRVARDAGRLPRPARAATLPTMQPRRIPVISGGELLARNIAVRPPPLRTSV